MLRLKFAHAKELAIFFDSKNYPGIGSENNLKGSIPSHPAVARRIFSLKYFNFSAHYSL
jgi:hypothetical protein